MRKGATKEEVLKIVEERGHVRTRDIVSVFGVSRQRAQGVLAELVTVGRLVKIGSTANASYATPEYASHHLEIFPTHFEKKFKNEGLEEHRVLDEVEGRFPLISRLKENVRSIFTYAFSEMLNNAIEHSSSAVIEVGIAIDDNKNLRFYVNDLGVGAFRNIEKKKGLKNEFEAIQELLKGKTTTQPKSHSGEGIFFTSKVGDRFVLDSYGYQLTVDNVINDVFVDNPKKSKKGTKIDFRIRTDSTRHLNDVFKKYTSEKNNYGFDKTEIKIKLYTIGGVHVSRSQARRVLSGLEKFRSIVLDFDKVPMVGQAFADEIFRVFHIKYPNIKIKPINMEEAVRFMIDRVEGDNPRKAGIFKDAVE